MAYTKQSWQDGSEGGTPVTASRLTHIEDGIASASVDFVIPYGTTSTTACVGDDVRLSDARTPTAHKTTHATGGTDQLTAADIAAAPTARLITAGTGLTGGGTLAADRTLTVTYGTATGTACVGNDTRLSDARTPLTHVHAETEVTNLVADLAAKAPTTRLIATGTGLTGGGSLAADRTLAVTYGTVVSTACQGNDTRLSDARTPLTHTHAETDVVNLTTDLAAKAPTARLITAGTGLTGGGSLALDRTLAVVYGNTAGTACQGNDARLSTVGVTYGTVAGTACQGNDVRLSDARTPLTHVHTEADVTNLTTDLAAKAPTARLISTGTGLTGGGNLTADRTIAVTYGTTAGTACQGNDTRLMGSSVTVSAIGAGITTTASTTFVDISTTVAIPFVVPPSGKVIVTYSADLWNTGASHSYLSYRISGTDTRAAALTTGAKVFGTDGVRSTAVNLVTGLTAGATNTATLQVVAPDGGTASAADKMVIVQPVI